MAWACTPPDANVDDIEARTRSALAANGIGAEAEIDLHATRKTTGNDRATRRILAAGTPDMAWEVLGVEPQIDAMRRCDVIPREAENGIEVTAVDPVASKPATPNDRLKAVTEEVRQPQKNAVDPI